MQLEDRARVWWAIGQPYRLSVNYEVRVVDIDAEMLGRRRPGAESSRASGVDVMTLHSLEPSSVETRSAASPLWLRLGRHLHRAAASGTVDVVLERKVGSAWVTAPPCPTRSRPRAISGF